MNHTITIEILNRWIFGEKLSIFISVRLLRKSDTTSYILGYKNEIQKIEHRLLTQVTKKNAILLFVMKMHLAWWEPTYFDIYSGECRNFLKKLDRKLYQIIK